MYLIPKPTPTDNAEVLISNLRGEELSLLIRDDLFADQYAWVQRIKDSLKGEIQKTVSLDS